MRAKKVFEEDVVQNWEEKTQPNWWDREEFNFSSDAKDFLSQYGVSEEEWRDNEISSSDVSRFVVDNWEDYWDSKSEMFAEQDFPGGVSVLVDELNVDMGRFEQSYDPGWDDYEEEDEEVECDKCGREYPEGEMYDQGDGELWCEDCEEEVED